MKWEKNTFTLTFNAAGGTCSITSKDITCGNAYGTLPTPTRSGYTFLGWYTLASGGTQVTSSTKMGNTDATIYAQWESNTITFTTGACNVENGCGTVTASYTLKVAGTYSYTVTHTYSHSAGHSQCTYLISSKQSYIVDDWERAYLVDNSSDTLTYTGTLTFSEGEVLTLMIETCTHGSHTGTVRLVKQ